ncbi:MAG: glycosyltransferase family 4 protein [Gammaproteobacteria bacterium]
MAGPAESSSALSRVVLVTGALDCGGAQRVLADLANHWASSGCRVTLATWSGTENRDFYSLDPAIERVWLGAVSGARSPVTKLRAQIARIRRLRALMRASRPDAVLSFIDVSNVLTLFAAAGLGLRVVVSERTNPGLNFTVPRPWRLLRKLVYGRASRVVAQTQDAAKWLRDHCGVDAAVIPNSLRELPLPSRPRENVVMGVGRLSAEKGFDSLLRAFARLASRFPAWKLQILGDGPDRARLAALRDELGLAGRAELAGEVTGVEEWLARAGLFVHASRREGFPNALLEAMGMGAAVVSTDCQSGPGELIADGVNGRLVPVDDIDELMRVMAELMAGGSLRERLGGEALKVRETYAPAAIMKKWEAVLVAPGATGATGVPA